MPFTFHMHFINYQLPITKPLDAFFIYFYLLLFNLNTLLVSVFCVISLHTSTLLFFIIFNIFSTFFYLSSLQLQTKPHSSFFLLLSCTLHILHNPPPVTSPPHIITLKLTWRSHLPSTQPSPSPLPCILLSFYNKILYFFIFS